MIKCEDCGEKFKRKDVAPVVTKDGVLILCIPCAENERKESTTIIIKTPS